MNIKIFITHTGSCVHRHVEDSKVFQNISAGTALDGSSAYMGDDTGSNISVKNRSYCELTTQYWAWKNVKADYYGFCHYRRFFSFNKEQLPESQWGRAELEYLSAEEIDRIGMHDDNVREIVKGFDLITAKGVDTRMLNGSDSVYEHYSDSRALRIEDLDLVMEIIEEKYPDYKDAARRHIKGHILFPCNMFIMRRALFEEYCTFLFGVLEEFEKRRNMDSYSRECFRTPGHLGERLLGIFRTYIESKRRYRLGELQQVYFRNVDPVPCFEPVEKEIPVVLAANNKYVPVLSVCLMSIVSHSSLSNIYGIYVFHTDIDAENRDVLRRQLELYPNFKIEFVNVSFMLRGYRLKAKEHITNETFFRFLSLEIMRNFSKILYIDCDTIVREDLAGLYRMEIGDNLVGAASDPDFIGQCYSRNCDTDRYVRDVLGLEPEEYFQAGVLVISVEKFLQKHTMEELLRMSEDNRYRYSDQDVLNIVCKGSWFNVGMGWNLITDCDHSRVSNVICYAPERFLTEYENARKKPNLIHYAGFMKPWNKLGEDYGELFWKVARETPFYEQLLDILQQGPPAVPQNERKNLVDYYNRLLPETGIIRKLIRAYIKPLFYKSRVGMKVINYMK